jgi:hypothetical protein
LRSNHYNLRKNRRAASPAISTVILTAAGIAVILVALNYSTGYLNSSMARNEFALNKQFMQTTGLQIDDVAWTIGRTQTITYSSRFGQVAFQPLLINYTFQVHTSSGWENLTVPTQTGVILYNMPVKSYSEGNNYFERLPGFINGSIVQNGSSVPVSQVFCTEKLPMSDGSYCRIVLVPTVRMLQSAIVTSQGVTSNYFKFYLPTLANGTNLYRSQSLTLNGEGITKVTRIGVDQVRITVAFPSSQFTSSFFNFKSNSVTLNSTSIPKLAANSIVEFYIGKVIVTLGQV